jgi:TonB family protein
MIKPRFIRMLVVLLATTLSLATLRPVQGADRRHDAAGKHGTVVTGRGVILVSVDSSSRTVTDARMLKSTGSKVLDDAAVNAFRKSKQRFKPGTPARVQIPITFTLTR